MDVKKGWSYGGYARARAYTLGRVKDGGIVATQCVSCTASWRWRRRRIVEQVDSGWRRTTYTRPIASGRTVPSRTVVLYRAVQCIPLRLIAAHFFVKNSQKSEGFNEAYSLNSLKIQCNSHLCSDDSLPGKTILSASNSLLVVFPENGQGEGIRRPISATLIIISDHIQQNLLAS